MAISGRKYLQKVVKELLLQKMIPTPELIISTSDGFFDNIDKIYFYLPFENQGEDIIESVENWIKQAIILELIKMYKRVYTQNGNKVEQLQEICGLSVEQIKEIIDKTIWWQNEEVFKFRMKIDGYLCEKKRNKIKEEELAKRRELEIAVACDLRIIYQKNEKTGLKNTVLVSQELVNSNKLTSSKIYTFIVDFRYVSKITRDIPNIEEDALDYLDDWGIAKKGAFLKSGDIVIGLVRDKEVDELTIEERLLKAIFWGKEKVKKDISLRVPKQVEGVVIDVKVQRKPSGKIEKVEVLLEHKSPLAVGDVLEADNGVKAVVEGIIPNGIYSNRVDIVSNNQSFNGAIRRDLRLAFMEKDDKNELQLDACPKKEEKTEVKNNRINLEEMEKFFKELELDKEEDDTEDVGEEDFGFFVVDEYDEETEETEE